jgi:DNA (cytosine-5)-methyltransferase 1
MKVAGLFAGIGGLEKGLARSGCEALAFSEIWPPASEVLAQRFPGVPNLGDVSAVVGLPGDTEVVTAGFPCQDLSQAGRTAGIGGSKSGLVDHVFRLLDDQRTPTVVLENVSFMLRLDAGSAMTRLVSAFEDRGYRWAYRVVNSLAYVPQRRERVFMVASRTMDPAEVLFADEAFPPEVSTRLDGQAHGFYWTEGVRGLGWGPDCVPTLKNGSTLGIPSPPAILLTNGEIVTPDIRDAERLQGFDAGWTEPAEMVGRRSLRWSLVGNAVTVDVAEWLGSRLFSPGEYDSDRDVPLELAAKWPRAARFDGRRRSAVRISDFPRWRERLPLQNFLHFPPHLLSERATAGFLSRIERSTLRFAPGFKDAVRRHLGHVRAMDACLGSPGMFAAAE